MKTTASVTYDKVGNRKTAKVGSRTSNFFYNNADQLTNPGVVHDANGNMTAGGQHGYTAQTFNLLDQATSVTPKGVAARSQEYGGQNQSIWLKDGQTRFANARSIGITASATAGGFTTFTRDPAGRLVSMKRGSQRAVYHYDGRGSVDSLTDATPGSSTLGKAIQRYGYEPYGRLTSATTGTLNQPFRWNAEYAINDYDYKIGARRYDASIARWTQTDPSGQDANNYAYAASDPINNADPSGLCVAGVFGECDNPVNDALTSIDDIDADIALGYGGLLVGTAGMGIAIGACTTVTAGACAAGLAVGAGGLAISEISLFRAYGT